MLEISLFGPPVLRRGDRELRFDTRKATALIAVLALTARTHSRDALVELLWPNLDRARARAALRRTLSVAAAEVGELRVTAGGIGLDPDAVRVDVVAFRAAAASDDPDAWLRAVDIANAPFLDGFALRDSPAFDDWRYAQAGELRDELALLLGMLSTHAERSGDVVAALAFARRRVAIDPLSEPTHVEVVRLAAASGDRSAAVRAYQDLVRVLDAELGVAPLPSTEQLHRSIQGSAGPPPLTEALADDEAEPPALTLQIVAALAVLDVPADDELLRSVAGRDDTELAGALPDAVRRGLVVADDDGMLRVPEAVGAGIVKRLPLSRRRLLHARAAEALARRAAADPSAVPPSVVGLRFADAGRDADAAGWFVLAADAASARGDHAAALDWWRAAITVGRDTVDTHLSLATTLIRMGRFAAAHVSVGRAADLAGDGAALLPSAADALADAERIGDLEGTIVLRSHLADLLHAAGREDEARAMQRSWAEALAALPQDADGWVLDDA